MWQSLSLNLYVKYTMSCTCSGGHNNADGDVVWAGGWEGLPGSAWCVEPGFIRLRAASFLAVNSIASAWRRHFVHLSHEHCSEKRSLRSIAHQDQFRTIQSKRMAVFFTHLERIHFCWLGGVVVRASDLCSRGRQLDSQPSIPPGFR